MAQEEQNLALLLDDHDFFRNQHSQIVELKNALDNPDDAHLEQAINNFIDQSLENCEASFVSDYIHQFTMQNTASDEGNEYDLSYLAYRSFNALFRLFPFDFDGVKYKIVELCHQISECSICGAAEDFRNHMEFLNHELVGIVGINVDEL